MQGLGLRPALFLELEARISGSPKGKRGIDPGKGSVTYAKCSDPKLPVSTHNTTQCLWTCFSRRSDFFGCVTTSPPSPPQTRMWARAHREVVHAGSRRAGDTASSDWTRPALCWRPVATGRRNSEARLGCPLCTGAQRWAPSPSDSTS